MIGFIMDLAISEIEKSETEGKDMVHSINI